MGNRTSAASGFDLGYMWRNQPERAAGGYYINAAQSGEAPGRWFGKGAEALGFAEWEVIQKETYMQVYQQIDPRTGQRMGRAPGGYAKFAEILARLEAAEPHATYERHLELEREAAQQVRRSPAYTDLNVGFDKTTSILGASIKENVRRARISGDAEAEALWQARDQRFQEILQEGGRRGLEYMQEVAAFTRTGYHGRRVEGVEPGRWEKLLPVVSVWLQATSRAGDPHYHLHNQYARTGITESDGKVRAADTMALRANLGGISAVVDAYVQTELTREFGVSWTPRADGYGCEIDGITQEWKDALSSRTQTVTQEAERLARKYEAKFGREPNEREMLFLRHEARDHTRKGKEEGEIDWDALAEKWDRTLGGELAGIADMVRTVGKAAPSGPPSQAVQELTVRQAVAAVQSEHSTWTRSDLLKALSWRMGQAYAGMDPDERQALLFKMADQGLGVDHGVCSLEAPEWPPVPPTLRRELDGRSVFTRPGTERYATRGQLSMEDKLLQQAQRMGGPTLDPAAAARLLGSDTDTLDRVLVTQAHDATQRTQTGLRYDQAALLYHAWTTPRRASVAVGPAGSGKSHTVGYGAQAWEATGGTVIGITASQAARNVLAGAGIANAMNSSQFLKAKPGQDIDVSRIRLPERSWIIVDEATTLQTSHMAAIMDVAERCDAKVTVLGDPAQLGAVGPQGAMAALARHLGYTQLAAVQRMEAAWEQEASLRLRVGDKTALEAYDAYGRITGSDRASVFAEARRAYVAARLAGEDVLLMAYSRDTCRELSRQIRDDLVHLGLVDGGRSAGIAGGMQCSKGDVIQCRENDHRLETDPGHTLANGDMFQVNEITDDGLLVQRVLEADRNTGAMRLAPVPVLYERARLPETDLAYAVTGHNGQGGTVARGEAVFTGGESREWAYVAMTRGKVSNAARVVTTPTVSDPATGTLPAPELARFRELERERAGLLPEPAPDVEEREPIAVLADCLDRVDAEPAAIEYQRAALLRADHLGLLHARWMDLTKAADNRRYEKLVQDALPEEWRQDLGPVKTWMARTLKSAEMAGMDAAEVVKAAVESRSLTGARDVASVVDARMRAMVDGLVPRAQGPWSERVPVVEPEHQEYVAELASAMDARKVRIGEWAAEGAPEWAVSALGPVPGDPLGRLEYEQQASEIGAYREMYGWDGGADPLGPEPTGSSPEQRAAWHQAYAAVTRTSGVDVRSLPDDSLWHMRGTYRSETEWAPPHVGKHLRSVRMGAETSRQQAVRAEAEREVAASEEIAARHEQLAVSARALEQVYRDREAALAKVQVQRDAWEQITRGSRVLAVTADSELRVRHPEMRIEPLVSAEPRVPDGDVDTSGWLADAEQRARVSGEKIEQRMNVRVPSYDPDYEDEGEAWPGWRADRDQILQPPKPELRPSPEVERQAQREMGG